MWNTRLPDGCPKALVASIPFVGGAREASRQERGNMIGGNIERNFSRARGLVLAMAGFAALYVVWGLIRLLS